MSVPLRWASAKIIDEVTTKSRTTDAARRRRWTLGIVYEVPIEWFAKELFYYPHGYRAGTSVAGRKTDRKTFVLFTRRGQA